MNKILQLGCVCIVGGITLTSSIAYAAWQCHIVGYGSSKAGTKEQALISVRTQCTFDKMPSGICNQSPNCVLLPNTVHIPITPLNGRWHYRNRAGPIIMVDRNKLTVNMSAYGRPTATGQLLSPRIIIVTFPDVRTTFRGKLSNNTIFWNNGTRWNKGTFRRRGRRSPRLSPMVTSEFGFDRPGSDYNKFRVHYSFTCLQVCMRDRRCKAYTFVRGGTCYLKNRVPPRRRHACCTSGVKR